MSDAESPPPRAHRMPARRQIAVAAVIGVVAALAIGVFTASRGGKHAQPTATKTTGGRVAAATVPATTQPAPTTVARSTTTHTVARSTTAPTTPSTAPTQPGALVALTIAAPSHQDSYDRAADFGPFIDTDHDCQNARAELLIRESQVPVTFTSARDCTVKTGRWTDPWSGETRTVARDFQIDHTVPLANAWRSGAWAWTHDQRVAYANDLTDADHLVAILAAENESKGDSGPDEWRPPARASWCRYALDWDRIKAKWNLTATASEWAALQEMAAGC